MTKNCVQSNYSMKSTNFLKFTNMRYNDKNGTKKQFIIINCNISTIKPDLN